MYRARHEDEPPIPVSAIELIQTISSTIFNLNYRHSVMIRIEEIDHVERYSIQKSWPMNY